MSFIRKDFYLDCVSFVLSSSERFSRTEAIAGRYVIEIDIPLDWGGVGNDRILQSWSRSVA